jgi:hypothetical protein
MIMLHKPLINTPLQRGRRTNEGDFNRFSAFRRTLEACAVLETAKAISMVIMPPGTQLKQGVNEKKSLIYNHRTTTPAEFQTSTIPLIQ